MLNNLSDNTYPCRRENDALRYFCALFQIGRKESFSCGLFVSFYPPIGYDMHKVLRLLQWKKPYKEVIGMTLNIVFFSITIKKRHISLQEAANQETVERLYEQNKDRQISMHRLY